MVAVWYGTAAVAAAALIAGWQWWKVRRALYAERAARRLGEALHARELHARDVEEARSRNGAAVMAGRVRAARLVLAEADAVVDAALARMTQHEHNEGGGTDG